jgi:diguanylate cyclase (GGDEF)-like protein
MKILLIDDSPDALAVAKARLAKENIDIICADGGIDGLEMACRERPDLILLDVDMPDMTGFEVCRRLKSDEALNLIPVIFVSGSGGASDKVKGLDLGAVDYVTKPFDEFELRARVRAALRTKHLQDILRDRAMIDPLTELANRRAYDMRFGQEWSRAQRHALPLSLIMADIDNFKRVNDQHGHQAGDEVLRQVARRLNRDFRNCDMLFRYGGEEFAMILPETAIAGAVELAERLRVSLFAEPIRVGNAELTVTASFGVADNDGVTEPDTLVRGADQSLYQAKSDGRNCVRAAVAAGL